MALSGDEVFGTEVPGFVTDGDGRLVVVGPGGESINANDTRWNPSGVLATTVVNRWDASVNNSLNSGFLRVTALSGKLEAGTSYSSIKFYAGTTGSTGLTQSWACLVDLTEMEVLASTASNTDAWTASTARTFSFSSAYTPAADIANAGVGIVVTASTPPTIAGVAGNSALTSYTPQIGGYEAGYTTPVAASTAITLTASGSLYYAEVS